MNPLYMNAYLYNQNDGLNSIGFGPMGMGGSGFAGSSGSSGTSGTSGSDYTKVPVVIVTGLTYTAQTNDYIILAICETGSTVYLPDSLCESGRIFILQSGTPNTNYLTVVSEGLLLYGRIGQTGGVSSLQFASINATKQIYSDGSNWWICGYQEI